MKFISQEPIWIDQNDWWTIPNDPTYFQVTDFEKEFNFAFLKCFLLKWYPECGRANSTLYALISALDFVHKGERVVLLTKRVFRLSQRFNLSKSYTDILNYTSDEIYRVKILHFNLYWIDILTTFVRNMLESYKSK